MPTMTVSGDLNARITQFQTAFDGGIARGSGSSMSVSSGASATVALSGSGLSVASSGSTFINGTVNEMVLQELDLNNIPDFFIWLTISDISESGANLFELIERTSTTATGRFDEAYFADFLAGEDWAITGEDGDDTIAPGVEISLGRNDTIDGGAGDDSLDGGAGRDVVLGGTGNDTIVAAGSDDVDAGADDDLILADRTMDGSVDGGADSDTLRLLASADGVAVDLAAGTFGAGGTVAGIEVVEALGTGDDTLTGDDGANRLLADGGADLLQGGAGIDTLQGGDGDDTLDGGAGADVLEGGDGYDVASYESATRSVRVDLQNPAISFGDAVGDTFVDIEEFQTGGGIDQLRGDGSENIFRTGGVSDRLYGRAGDDMLFGEAGADAFYGGLGADTMTAGDDAGRRDRFIYFNAAESDVGAGNRDVITDYVPGEDRIELSRIDADITQGFKQRFDFIGDAAFSNTAGELRFEQQGGITLVQADRDGDGIADFEIELTGTLTLTTDDFLI
ncbi:calcium-binding protein [Pseudaestuariivita atlantica]|uniref:Uncharacterized protein n=1 Tax=Pseudaestuariivita atlantica TaxID=1317121 RepID=A0A0L1JKF7_9RHOB|nr:M10 family metallopeptidase C-terminal domain-containing protein [Pseudaestuariivita atlantica]KNG92231.1 hypothetical protein ATO11_18405 [Pseudaestuariivita atlantica]